MMPTRLEDKLDECTTAVTKLTTRLENYPAVVADVADHENRLTALEALEVKKYSDRLAKLEGAMRTFKGWIAGASAVALASGGLIAWAWNNIADKL